MPAVRESQYFVNIGKFLYQTDTSVIVKFVPTISKPNPKLLRGLLIVFLFSMLIFYPMK